MRLLWSEGRDEIKTRSSTKHEIFVAFFFVLRFERGRQQQQTHRPQRAHRRKSQANKEDAHPRPNEGARQSVPKDGQTVVTCERPSQRLYVCRLDPRRRDADGRQRHGVHELHDRRAQLRPDGELSVARLSALLRVLCAPQRPQVKTRRRASGTHHPASQAVSQARRLVCGEEARRPRDVLAKGRLAQSDRPLF